MSDQVVVDLERRSCDAYKPIPRRKPIEDAHTRVDFYVSNHVCELEPGHYPPHRCWCGWTYLTGDM